MGKKLVITGPTGAVGAALIRKSIERGWEVLAICHKGSGRLRNIPSGKNVRIIEADLGELQGLAAQLHTTYDVFYHLAWMGTTGEARNDMRLQLQNIRYTLDAIDLAKKLGCSRFVGVGSQAEYGRTETLLTAETPVFPENGYGIAKLCAGQMSRKYCESQGMEHFWVRILSVYGPCDGERSMVSTALRTFLEGGHMSFTPGEQMWDYVYSEDAGEALCLLAEKGIPGKTYVLGSGHAEPLKNYIEEMYTAVCECGIQAGSIGFGDVPYGKGQVMHLGANIGELQEDTGFVPQVSFADGIRRTLAWMQEEKERDEKDQYCHSVF